MYAVIQSGSRQYRAEAGQRLQVDKLDRKLGESFDIENVVFVGGDKPAAGTPFVKGAKVSVVVVQQARGPKILIFKKKRRHGYRRLKGHRQDFTELFVTAISANGQTVKAESKPVVVDPTKKAERVAKYQDSLNALPKAEKKAKAAQKKVAKKAAGAKKKTKSAPKKKAAKKTKKAKK